MPKKATPYVKKLKHMVMTQTAIKLFEVKNASKLAHELDIEPRSVQRSVNGEQAPHLIVNTIKHKKKIDQLEKIKTIENDGPAGLPLWKVLSPEIKNIVSYDELRQLEYKLFGSQGNQDNQDTKLWFELIMSIKMARQTHSLTFRYGDTMHYCSLVITLNIIKQLLDTRTITAKIHSMFISAFFKVVPQFGNLRKDIDPLYSSPIDDEQDCVSNELQQQQSTINKDQILIDLWGVTAPVSLARFIKPKDWFTFRENPFDFCDKPTDYEAYFEDAPENVKKFWKGSFKYRILSK